MRRAEFQNAFIDWFAGLGSGEPPFGLPDEWDFDFPADDVKIGFYLWKMSGFQKFPTHDDVRKIEKRWFSDMQFAMEIYEYTHNDHPMMVHAREYALRNKDKQ